MKSVIIENKERKTVTLVLGGVRFFYARYLLERYDDSRYFGSGILQMTKEELNEMLKKISLGLNSVNPQVKVSPKSLFEGDEVEYPIFKRNLKDDEWTGMFEVALTVFSDKRERALFWEDLSKTKAVLNEDEILGHEWAIELEFSTKIDEKTLDTRIFTILHRIVKGKKVEGNYRANDEAWVGFDLGVDDDEVKNVHDDDLF